jgi:hypothetical protein
MLRTAAGTAAIFAATAVAWLLAPTSALASGCTDSWARAASGSWFEAANWSTGKVPTSSDEVCITAAGTYTVSVEPTTTSGVSVTSLALGASSGTQSLTVASTSASGSLQLSASQTIGVGAHGVIALTSRDASTTSLSGTITNSGTVEALPGAGGGRTIYGSFVNDGAVDAGEGVSLQAAGTFTNAAGGSVSATGTGRLWVFESTFKQGAGTTSGPAPVVVELSSLEYTGSGASHIVARGQYDGYGSSLKGNLSAGQTLTIEGSCNANGVGTSYWSPTAMVEASSSFTNAGTITLTSGSGGGPTCSYETEARLDVLSGATLTNTGTIDAEPGLGGERVLEGDVVNNGTVRYATSGRLAGSFENEGAVDVSEGASLQTGGTFTNGAGGTIAAAGTGRLWAFESTFKQGAGTMSGSAPVVVEQGNLEYTGSGASHIVVRGEYDGSGSSLKGTLSAGQYLTIEGSCNANGVGTSYWSPNAVLEASSSFTNAGTITLTSGSGGGPTCTYETEARLDVTSNATLINTGTIDAETGLGGGRSLEGDVVNAGTVRYAASGRLAGSFFNEGAVDVSEGASLQTGATFINAAGGNIAATGTGRLWAFESTFKQGAGTTSGPAPVVVEQSNLEYTGSGASHIVARGDYEGYGSELRGNLSPGQYLTIEGSCNANGVGTSYWEPNAILEASSSFTNAGTITLTSASGGGPTCTYETEARLNIPSKATLTNTGTINAEAGLGGQRILQGETVNQGTVNVAEGVSLRPTGTFVNAAGGTIAATGTGRLWAFESTFEQGAGTMSGLAPVVVEQSSLQYTGPGASHIVARGDYEGYGSELRGNLSPGQYLTIEGSCNAYGVGGSYWGSNAILEASSSFTNAGTITLTSASGGGGPTCTYGTEARLNVPSKATLTNTGTIDAEAGLGGQRILQGEIENEGTVALQPGVTLQENGSYSQGKSGRLKTAIGGTSDFGALSVNGTATLAGTLELAQVNGFRALDGQRFAIVTAGSRAGGFEFVKGAAITSSLSYSPLYSPTGVTLEAIEGSSEPVPTETSPPVVSGAARQGQSLVLTHGAWTHSPFEYEDQWLRCSSAGSACEAIAGADGDSYVLSGADAGHTLRVEEVAFDPAGESAPAESAATAVVESSQLRAVAGEAVSAVEGAPATLDGSGSSPAGEIASYRWAFGDGETVEGAGDAVVHHVYRTAGHYTATLTVTRGGEHESTSVPVSVAAAPQPAEGVSVVVRDGEGQPLEGAAVLYVAPAGARSEATTGSSGEAVLGALPEGADTLYAYKSGYRPKAVQVTVDGEHRGSATVQLESGQVATAGLSSHEMTLGEIEKAGIDPSDPANQNVYAFEVKLAFTESSEPPVELHGAVNAAGQFVGSYGASGGGAAGSGEGGSGGGGGGGGAPVWSCSPTQCETTGEPADEGDRIIAVPKVVENHPLIQWLILKGKAAVLKQFYEVSMVVQNLSEELFALTPGTARLSLPEGMSLAPTPVAQTAAQAMPEIGGGHAASAAWIVRGDEPGEYLLSANYEAKLQPFEAPVQVQAALASPLRVWGANALELRVRADSGSLSEGVPYHVSLGVTNRANVPLYNVGLSIEEQPHEHFIFQPGQRFSEELGELTPGQTSYIEHPYILVPDGQSQSIFNPALSSATFAGEEAHPGEGVEAVAPPTLYAISAPGDVVGAVHLHWQAVPGAEGYEVFSTPTLDTPFKSALPVSASPGGETVTELPSDATDAYIAAAEPSRFYAVSAIVGHEAVLDHAVIEASPGLPSAPDFGRCVKVSPERAGGQTVYNGGYTAATCLTASATHTGKYEWDSGVSRAGFTSAGGAVTLETAGKAKVTCASEEGSGSITTARTVGDVVLRLKGCELTLGNTKARCSTAGLGSGELEATNLEGALGFEAQASKKVGLDLYPAGRSGSFMQFSCNSSAVTLTGSVIGSVKADKMAAAETLKFKASKGKQKPEAFEGAAQDVLLDSLSGAKAEQDGLTLGATLTYEEAVEINAVA